MITELIKHLPLIATIIAASALAIAIAVFSIFFRSKFKEFEELKESYAKLKSHLDTLKIPDNLNSLQALQKDFAELGGRELSTRTQALERASQAVLAELAGLRQSEAERNQRLQTAIDAQTTSIKILEGEIAQKVAKGDKENLVRLLEWRVEQLETKYILAKIQGGIREEQARDDWARAKDDLSKTLRERATID